MKEIFLIDVPYVPPERTGLVHLRELRPNLAQWPVHIDCALVKLESPNPLPTIGPVIKLE